MWKDFKAFIMRGNVVDLAVAVIIGAAFGAIVTSLVNDIIMPVVGQATGKVNFTDLFYALNGQHYANLAAAQADGAAVIAYGIFINTIITFIIIAFVIFIVIRAISRLQKAPIPPAPTTKECQFCHTQIPIPATRCPNCTSELK